MMKYLAVISDSFREAFASRILWLLLIAITLLLGLLAPFGFREVATTNFTGDDDYTDPWELLDHIRKEGQKPAESPTRSVWLLMDEKYRSRLANAKLPSIDREQGNVFEAIGVLGDLGKEFNKLLERPDLVDGESWKEVHVLSEEAKKLAEKHREKKLTPQELPRFNRLMLEAAFSGMLRESPPKSVQWRYGWMDVLSPDPLTGDSIRSFVQDYTAWVLKWIVGVAGVLLAILVTSPIVPQMFDQGSLHLLLSKPISRWMLLLSKYVGGCAFIVLTASYLIVGLWLILGMRLGIWESRLLLSIPIYLFVFSMYYSVSTLAGVVWRSPIVCVAVAVLFWAGCRIVGLMDGAVERGFVEKDRMINVLDAGDSIIATNEMGWHYEWDQAISDWRQVFTSNEQRNMFFLLRFVAPAPVPREMKGVGPVYDRVNDQLISTVPVFTSRAQNLCVGKRKSKWDKVTKTNSPLGTVDLLVEPDGKVLFISSLGIFRMRGDPVGEQKPVKLFGMELPIPSGGPLQSVNPEPALLVTDPADAAINRKTGEIAIFTRATITTLERGKTRFTKKIEQKLDGGERQGAVLAFGGDRIVVGRSDGRVQMLDAATLKQLDEFKLDKDSIPRFIDASPDGRWFSILSQHGRLWLIDAQQKSFAPAAVSGQRSISAATFSSKGNLFVIDRGDRLIEYRMDPLTEERRMAPSMNIWLWTYRYVIWPIYIVFPKPSEMDRTFDYVLEKKSEAPANRSLERTISSEKDDPWTPLWSSAVFTAAVLLLSCVYIHYQEF